VRASELGEFSYCERAWWLRRVCGHRPNERGRTRLARGRRAHVHHAQAVARGGADRRLGWMLVALALLLLLAALAA
jgi:CRISPR/Cas system-associated exonuclease Cas4 (RecB family)